MHDETRLSRQWSVAEHPKGLALTGLGQHATHHAWKEEPWEPEVDLDKSNNQFVAARQRYIDCITRNSLYSSNLSNYASYVKGNFSYNISGSAYVSTAGSILISVEAYKY